MDNEHAKKGERPSCAAIIVAAGHGARMGGAIPKQFMDLRGKPVIAHSLMAFAADTRFQAIVVVCNAEWAGFVREIAASHAIDVMTVNGGATRRASVAEGLKALRLATADEPDYVFIHDAARPGLTQETLDILVAALNAADAAIPVLPVVDSMAMAQNGQLQSSLDRSQMVRVQTPQAFRTDALIDAHDHWDCADEPTDDARMVQARGRAVAVVRGDERLIKLTHPADFALFNAMHDTPKDNQTMRIGQGYDVHRLELGEELWLCGLKIDHSHGLSGHSDADVALHAVTDALLGAIGEGDIGTHFPPSDPQWRGARSDQFVRHAVGLIREKGFRIANIDVTLICERPKIGPHREIMRQSLSDMLGTPIDCVSVKATTTEGLGFTGREEGIAAQAIVLLIQ